MIVLGEKQNGINVLHVIIGPETEFQFNLAGQSVMDISEYISGFKAGDKCLMVVNRCNSEDELLTQIQFQQSKMKAMQMMNQFALQMNQKSEEVKDNKSEPQNTADCPSCGGKNLATIVNNSIYPCAVCRKIEEGLKTKTVPPVPSIEHLKDIKKKTEETNPSQKNSVFKFRKKTPNKNTDNDQEKK